MTKGRVVIFVSRTWVEHDLFPMLSLPVNTYLQEKKKEGLRPSCSTHVRESPRTWATRPGGKAGEQARDLSHNQRITLTSASVARPVVHSDRSVSGVESLP